MKTMTAPSSTLRRISVLNGATFALVVAAIWTCAVTHSWATTFNIADGDVAALVQAIKDANDETTNPGSDTINLAVNGTYTLTAMDNAWYGPNGLPPIASDITI